MLTTLAGKYFAAVLSPSCSLDAVAVALFTLGVEVVVILVA